jgi:RNA 2',3'-cyclic 3'-phosphodiesterase
VRLFVAVPIAPAVRDAVAAALAPVRAAHPGVSWTQPDGWHLTLAFLGEVAAPGPAIDAVGPVAAAHPTARLTLGDPGRFADRVLWLAVHDHPAGALIDLAADVGAGLVDAGLLAPDDPAVSRPLRAHLTLARKRRQPIDDPLVAAVRAALDGAGANVTASWPSRHVELWRSHLGQGPARYEVTASFATVAGADAAASEGAGEG